MIIKEKQYLAHISEDKMRIQTVKEHLQNTAFLAQQFATTFHFGEFAYCAGLLHDIGKYSVAFQERIRGSTQTVDHATAGAQVCMQKGGLYSILAYCITGHHAGLPDTGEKTDVASSATFCGRMKKQIEVFDEYEKEIQIPALKKISFDVDGKKDPSFEMGFLIRMLYSSLVDADYLDTESFMQNGQTKRESGEEIKVLQAKMVDYVAEWLKNKDLNTLNGRRSEILNHCLQQGKQSKGMFRLTVPTGGGKTVASLAFALEHALEHSMNRIIYVIPYTSIIEQNAHVFREILGEENVLEHHSNVEYESTEELKAMHLATENWDKPVIVTTNVQFFESLFSNKSSKCRKLHNIANSIIIFDEAQMLPNDYLKPCTKVIEELVKHYESSVVLCTATQPSLTPFFSENIKIQELCPRLEEQFSIFKRNIYRDIGCVALDELGIRLQQEHQVLCILNTKKEAQNLYEQIRDEGVYHLTTLMYPKHRNRVIEVIRRRLVEKRKCIVVSTSLVEAGVDLDFQSVYRQLAGIDSIIQAAGRCNREGKRKLEESSTYIYTLAENETVPGQQLQIDTAKNILRNHEDISSLETIQDYFSKLYNFQGESLDKKKILEKFKKGRFEFATVGKEFRLIEQNTKTIFIPIEEQAQAIQEEIELKGATKSLMRKIGQYCVNVYENMFNKLYGNGMLTEMSAEFGEDFYILRNPDDYLEDMGLRVDIESGIDIWY